MMDPADSPPDVPRSEAFSRMAADLDRNVRSATTQADVASHVQVLRDSPPAKPATAEAKAAPPPERTASPDDPQMAKAADWKKLKSLKDAAAEEAKTYKQELAELKAKLANAAIDPKEIETLKAERDELEQHLSRTNLANLPKFKRHYETKLDTAIKTATTAVGEADYAKDVRNFLAMPSGDERKKVLAAVAEAIPNALDKQNFLSAIGEYDQTLLARENALMESREHLKAWHDQQAQQARAHQAKVIEQVLQKAQAFPSFQRNGDESHNAAVERNISIVKAFITGDTNVLDEASVSAMPILAAEGMRLATITKKQAQRISELESAIVRYRGSAPVLEGGGNPRSEPSTPSYAPGNFVAQVLANLASMPAQD